jgi:hypothetical protein
MVEQIEIDLKRKNKNNDYEIYLFTVYYDNEIFSDIIKEHTHLNNIKKIIIFGLNDTEVEDNDLIEVIDTGLDNINDITYNYIFDYMFKNYQNKICVLCRSDVYLINQNSLEFLPFHLKNNLCLCISSLNIDENGNVSKDQEKMKSFYSLNQDCWILKPNCSINFDDNNMIKFNLGKNELKLNYILNNNYKLLNDTENFKVICKIHKDNENLRKKNENFDSKNTLVLPETLLMNKVGLDNLVKFLNMNNMELYDLKTELLKKVIIKKGFL